MLDFLSEVGAPTIVAITKVDKLGPVLAPPYSPAHRGAWARR
jgi:hypothetical protein